ncbi:hypothetical protein FQR65_LT10083 [Abscondita terminalis]|nr:hypothetical protein FQR65_LT10083 [Abscondita terminalis]
MPYRGRNKRHDNYKRDRPRDRQRNFNKTDSNRQFHQQSFTEKEVGITEYITDLEGFSGIIKARYSDFQVNEINNSGEIAKLTDLCSPADFNVSSTNVEVIEDATLLPDDTWAKIKELSTNEKAEPFEIDAETFTKEHRTKIYECIRSIYGKAIVVQTQTKDEKKVMHFKKYTSDCHIDTRFQWPKDKGEYVYFLLYKEAADTLEACFKISDCLRMKSSSFTYAGVKDKRAKTTQWFCVKKVIPQKLVSKSKYLRNIHVGNFTFHSEPLKLGQLKGNRFRVALRNVEANEEVINTALESLKLKGFINYYGLQRFGSDKDVPTFKLGVALLRGQWKEVCNLILSPKKNEDPCSEISQAKRVFKETSNSELASKKFFRWYNKCVESKLLLGLAKNHVNDYVTALENIPRNVRLLYVHSFQSLIWNQMVSKRIKEFGLKPIIGDLVLMSEECAPTVEVNEAVGETDTYTDAPFGQEVKVLTEDDLEKYSIYDIVLPLPGYDIKYPENAVKTWYKEALEHHGLSLELPKQKVKTYNISGTYRKMLARINNLSWKVLRYDHPNDVLIRSDYEELIGNEEPIDNPEGQYKGLVMDFCLDSSCYATMVLREVLKTDTSTSHQATLNNYHKSTESDETPHIPETESLLDNPKKFEQFKKQMFDVPSSSTEKHKSEDDDGNASKKLKTSEEDDGGIKIQPSLVSKKYDVVIIGGGIVGVASAREFLLRHPQLKMALVEKESKLAMHQSGHNSGVIHAGIYYKPGSLKAKLCIEGFKSIYKYCDEKKIPYKKVGKLIVATHEKELPSLKELEDRGQKNEVPDLLMIDGKDIKKYEPYCEGIKALSSPHTGIVDFVVVCEHYGEDFKNAGGTIHLNFKVNGFKEADDPNYPVLINSSDGHSVQAKFVVTCGGLYSDVLAELSGCSKHPRIIPFRGEYLLLKPEKSHMIKGNIYPVLDPRYPFLGAHFTPKMDGSIWLGPNAVFAFRREGYKWTDIDGTELMDSLRYPGFRKMARRFLATGINEIIKSLIPTLQVKDLQRFVNCINPEDVILGPAGVRAQALDKEGNLVDDFIFDIGKDKLGKRILHCRNASAAGAASSQAVAKLISDKIESHFEIA